MPETKKQITKEQMAYSFGFDAMTDCVEVIERFALEDGAWVKTHTFRYADGTAKTVPIEAYHHLVPAAPGWVALTDSGYGAEPVRALHAVAFWQYVLDRRDSSYVMPMIPGDTSVMDCVAVVSPDGRVFEIRREGCLRNEPFPSIEAWQEHVDRKRAEEIAERERRDAEREKLKCPACGRQPSLRGRHD
jgi:hypothetical protein